MAILKEHWGSSKIAICGALVAADELPGLVAFDGKNAVGLMTYRFAENSLEIVTLNALVPQNGIGKALIAKIKKVAENKDLQRIHLITTNDNLDALRFYQKNGFVLVGVKRDAVSISRLIKPSIPLIGNYDIPIRDEIELEFNLPKKKNKPGEKNAAIYGD